MKLLASAAVAALLLGSFSAPARAQDFLVLGAGEMGIFDNDDGGVDARAEYRWGEPVLFQIKPMVGLEVNEHGAIYGMGGLYLDYGMAPHWYLTPSFAAGLYHDGGGPDLGHTIEFRSQVEVAYEFENQHRVSMGLSHVSNMGMGDDNPGTEVLNLNWHVPVNWWSGGGQ